MNEPGSGDIDRLRHAISDAIHGHWKLFLLQGLVMMALGLVAVALPNIATVAVDILAGWLFFAGGLFRTLTVLRRRQAPGFWLSLLTAVLALVLGLALIALPRAGVLTLTMVLVAIFAVEGIAAVFIALDYRRHMHNWGWTLLSGAVNLVLAYLIWRGWPGTAAWAVGLFVGINMFMLGLSLTMTAIAARTMGPR